MIEKLEPTGGQLRDKINELVDAVNGLESVVAYAFKDVPERWVNGANQPPEKSGGYIPGPADGVPTVYDPAKDGPLLTAEEVRSRLCSSCPELAAAKLHEMETENARQHALQRGDEWRDKYEEESATRYEWMNTCLVAQAKRDEWRGKYEDLRKSLRDLGAES